MKNTGKPVRLLMGIPRPNLGGGPPTHLPFLVSYFRSHQGYQLKTFWFGRRSDTGEPAVMKVVNTLMTLGHFMLLLITFRPHIIHLNTAFDKRSVLRDLPFVYAVKITGIPLLVKLHGSLPDMIYPEKAVWRHLRNLFLKGAMKIGVLSGKEREEFLSVYPYPEKIRVVKNILPEVQADDTGTAKSGGLFVSRMIREKGVDDLIGALPLIRKKIPGFRAVFAGDGPYLEKAREAVIQNGQADAAIWNGYIPHAELAPLYNSAMIFIFCSGLPEGMPMALAGALVAGLPVVTTPVRFALDYLQEGVHCLYYPAGDPGKLAAAVVRLAEDPDLQIKMGQANRDLVRQFSREIVGKEFENIYHEMLV